MEKLQPHNKNLSLYVKFVYWKFISQFFVDSTVLNYFFTFLHSKAITLYKKLFRNTECCEDIVTLTLSSRVSGTARIVKIAFETTLIRAVCLVLVGPILT